MLTATPLHLRIKSPPSPAAPLTTAIELVIPELQGKLKWHAQRVLTLTGSVTELVLIQEKKVTDDEINAALKKPQRGLPSPCA